MGKVASTREKAEEETAATMRTAQSSCISRHAMLPCATDERGHGERAALILLGGTPEARTATQDAPSSQSPPRPSEQVMFPLIAVASPLPGEESCRTTQHFAISQSGFRRNSIASWKPSRPVEARFRKPCAKPSRTMPTGIDVLSQRTGRHEATHCAGEAASRGGCRRGC
jgi:hypothetical protein